MRGLHPGAREASPSGPIIILHHLMPKHSNPLPLRLQWLSQAASHNPKDNHQEYINRVSDMNSKKRIKIPFIMAKTKRKISKNSVKKNQKIQSLNKAIHFPSPSLSVSFSYPKQQHRGSLMLKSKQKSPLKRRRRLMDRLYLIFERMGRIRTTSTRRCLPNTGL